MSKKSKTTLVIVESPAKCKKIEELLGPGYKCVASYGHLRTIASLKDVDISNQFKPTYSIINETIKKKQMEVLRKEIKNAREVILSSDLDREGEMIAYSIIELFNLPLTTKRITFNEITETALLQAIQKPRTIDMNIVQAQQARQILDILVGFKVSPILWKLIKSGKENALSAGRCQTPALKLVYENQRDIDASIERKIYNVTGYFTNSNLPFHLNAGEKLDSENLIQNFLQKSADFSHIYTCSLPVKTFKKPPDPFTTSRLQQVASNELHYSPKETMRICQLLYEGGYITYMRTDSNKYSNDFLALAQEYIGKTYHDAIYFNAELHNHGEHGEKTKPNAQEAHEAIRPTNISLEHLPEEMSSKERRMYKLIWTNTLESCMVPASFYSVAASITAPDNLTYSYTAEQIDFLGWKIVDNKFSRENKEYFYLQTIKKGSSIVFKKICANVMLKGCKQHYTEARLVQLLEEKGIGRPSTFSSLIDKIQERGYVKKEDVKGKEILCKDFELEDGEIKEIENRREFGNEKSKLIIQPLGIIVMEFLEKHFNKLFNYEYTSLMETSLDKVAKGELLWTSICDSCNKELDDIIESVKDETKYECQIDENNTFLIGKYGPVIKCVEDKDGVEEITFKPVKKEVDISKLKRGELVLDELVETTDKKPSQRILGTYDNKEVILKKGKYGLYVLLGKETKPLKELGNRPIENITLEEVTEILEKGFGTIREIHPFLSIKKGPKGDYLFYKNKKMKKPAFYDIKSFTNETKEDYKTCNLAILKSWITEKYAI